MPDIEEVLETIAADLATMSGRETKGSRTGSRYVGSGADPACARHVAEAGTADTWKGGGRSRTVTKGAGIERGGIDFLRDVKGRVLRAP